MRGVERREEGLALRREESRAAVKAKASSVSVCKHTPSPRCVILGFSDVTLSLLSAEDSAAEGFKNTLIFPGKIDPFTSTYLQSYTRGCKRIPKAEVP